MGRVKDTWESLARYCVAKGLSRRAVLHWAQGVFVACCCMLGPAADMRLVLGWVSALVWTAVGIAAAALFLQGFIFYEANEDEHLRDQAHKDMFGFLTAFAVSVVVIVCLLLRGGMR